jgi:hypothetical protein
LVRTEFLRDRPNSLGGVLAHSRKPPPGKAGPAPMAGVADEPSFDVVPDNRSGGRHESRRVLAHIRGST